MYLLIVVVIVAAAAVYGIGYALRAMRHREVERYSIEPEALHDLLEKNPDVLVYDVRQPLDLLAHSEIIPGAKRVAPKEVIAQANLIPRDKDAVVYCTCVSEKTSRMIIEKTLKQDLTRVKFLKGGLAAWKEKGYPVVRYDTPFHLDTAS